MKNQLIGLLVGFCLILVISACPAESTSKAPFEATTPAVESPGAEPTLVIPGTASPCRKHRQQTFQSPLHLQQWSRR